jgi:hypothetical protein
VHLDQDDFSTIIQFSNDLNCTAPKPTLLNIEQWLLR